MEEESSGESVSDTDDSLSASDKTSQESSECDSSLEVCGVTLTEIGESSNSKRELEDEDLERMLAKDLSPKEKEDFKAMLRRNPYLFISNYVEILGVRVVKHHINLKPNQKPVALKLGLLIPIRLMQNSPGVLEYDGQITQLPQVSCRRVRNIGSIRQKDQRPRGDNVQETPMGFQ